MIKFGYNISKYYAKANAFDLSAGKAAYPAYLSMMRMIAREYELPTTHVTEAFAALSPNNDYYGNLRSLTSVLHGMRENKPYTVSTYKACAQRAESYLNGSVDFMSTVKGPKIRAFRNCILNPVTCQDLVLDGHMIAVAFGQNLTMKEAQIELGKHGQRTKTYDAIVRAYVRAARVREITPSTLQAVIWFCRKRTESIKLTTQRDFWRDDARLFYTLDEIPPYPNNTTA